jgi:hypothetical protein
MYVSSKGARDIVNDDDDDDDDAPNKRPGGINAPVRELLWVLTLRLRTNGPRETAQALDAGLIDITDRFIRNHAGDKLTYQLYHSRNNFELIDDNDNANFKEVNDGELR